MTALRTRYYRLLPLGLLGLVLILSGYFLTTQRSDDDILDQAQHHLQQEIHKQEQQMLAIASDSLRIFRALEQSTAREQLLTEVQGKPFHILAYREGELQLWTSNEVIPRNINRVFRQPFNFVRLNNAWYEVLRKDYQPDVTVLAILPVYYVYPLENQYLVEGFHLPSPQLRQVRIGTAPGDHAVVGYDGEPLFNLIIAQNAVQRNNPLLMLLQFIGLLLLLAAGIRLSASNIKREKYAVGIPLLTATLAAGIGLHYSGIMLYTDNLALFSSRVYASSKLISSLGILLLWSLSILAVILFINRFLRLPKVSRQGGLSDLYVFLLYLFNALVFLVTTLIINSVVTNSTISFDFYNFYTLSVFSLTGMCIFAIWFVILFVSFNRVVFSTHDVPLWKKLIMAVACSLAVALAVRQVSPLDPVWIGVFFLMTSLYFILTENSFLKFAFINYLIIVSIFSWTTAHVITANIATKQFDKQKDFISELLFERDLSEEFQLMESGNEILRDNFVKSYFQHPFLNDYQLEERLRSRYFNKFEDRYNIYVYAYNTKELPLKGELEKDYTLLNDLFRKRSTNTVSANIRYFSGAKENLKYLIYYPISRDGEALGHLFVEVVPKVFGSSSAYPELLIAGDEESVISEDEYEYAIYENGQLQKSRGDYEYTASLNFDEGKQGDYIFYNDEDYHHLVYNNDDETVVILSKRKRSIISPFSAFSYTFCFYLLVILLLWAIGLRKLLLTRNQIPLESQPVSLQRRIQISMISLVLSSLFIIGVVTLIYFQNQYNTYHNARLLRKANSLMKHLNAYMKDEAPADPTEVDFENVIQHRILTLARIHSLDINVYRTNGQLMISSQPDIFNKELVSGVIDPMAMLHLRDMGKSRHVQNEMLGKLQYLSAYLPYRNNEGMTIAYLHFPYYSKQQSFRADISYFLVALVNVYVLLILTATAIALLLSRSITTSLTIIKERLSTIKLREKNVPIEWKNKDEIGMLVGEYNRMIVELEKSAELLARSERETAWREMAKQVAHEIKNPLTPMKLSIQHLQRALKEDRPDTKELTQQVTDRLIEQIDSLTNIASEFSSFATMPVAKLQKVDLREVVHSTASLFQNLRHVTVGIELPDDPCFVKADKNQLIGVFNNLFKNASQAISEDGEGRIWVRLLEKDGVYRVEVEDNGMGIPEEKRAKVFEPNFTTKSSGTGLGLAISRNIIEKSEGNIWFESEVGKGTIFYVILPKYEEQET